MFKKSIVALSLIALSSAVLADSAPVVNLKVTGSIKAPSCTMSSGSDDLEYKYDVSLDMLSTGEYQALPEKKHTIEVICDAVSYMSLTVDDIKYESVAPGVPATSGKEIFGLGTTSGDSAIKIGHFIAHLQDLKFKESSGSSDFIDAFVWIGTEKKNYSDVYLKSGSANSAKWVFQAKGLSSLAAGQVFQADLGVIPYLNPALKNAGSEVNLDGHLVLTFSFAV